MGVDFKRKRRKLITHYDGVSMHFTPNYDNSAHAFSSSRGNGNGQIYLVINKELEQCTSDDTMNTCPVFNHDGSLLYYCSDEKIGVPHIMSYHCVTKKSVPLPIIGYCVTPAYNNTRKLLAYSKMIDGIMQICVYNPITDQERQLTFDQGNHEDPTWSPCGHFLAYTHEQATMSRIRVHCYTTGYERYITPPDMRCDYPAWSLY
jgi:Tol biopolymer transport system component